jgi:hypothetical protein
MNDYFEQVSIELLSKLGQVKSFIQKHNETIGILTEEILRNFLSTYLPKQVNVEQGFIRHPSGEMSKQCDIIIYDAIHYAPFYRINDIVIVPSESVLAVIEVKTTINSSIFHSALDYFKELKSLCRVPAHLFIYKSSEVESLESYFRSYEQKHGPYTYDHDTFELLPDEITGIDKSYHLKQDYAITDRDTKGYSSFFYVNEEGTEINALQHFYLSIYRLVERHIRSFLPDYDLPNREHYFKKSFDSYFAIELFVI